MKKRAKSFITQHLFVFHLHASTKVSCVGFVIWSPSGRCVVCFSFDQPIVASDSRLSYACILLFPMGTQYPAGSPIWQRLAMTIFIHNLPAGQISLQRNITAKAISLRKQYHCESNITAIGNKVSLPGDSHVAPLLRMTLSVLHGIKIALKKAPVRVLKYSSLKKSEF